jgi:hypothetical protein
MSKLIVNCETGEETVRELSKPEKDQKKIDEALDLQIQAEIAAKAAERQAIADRLGLTADELKLLIG